MKILLFVWIILQLGAFYMTQATSIQNIYKKTEPEQNITGKRGAELTVVSQLECTIKCRGGKKCVAYQYRETGPGNCLLILQNCSDIEGPIFEQEKGDLIFKEVSLGWSEPNYWTGPKAVLYQSLDSSDGLILMEGPQEVCHTPLVSGKVNSAWYLNQTQNQWIDLGVHTEVCIARPETCTAGGAISLWLNIMRCDDWAGIISSFTSRKTAVQIYSKDVIRFSILLPDRIFDATTLKPTGWTNIILNYIGPQDGQGIRLYYNGQEVASHTSKGGALHSVGDGRIVVGRFYTDIGQDYSSVQVDELIFFNQPLSTTDIEMLYNTV